MSTHPASILVVDDNDDNRYTLLRRLARDGHVEATAVGSGPEALAHLAVASVDLVLLDVMMPGMDGVEVLTRLKADPRRRHIPVIMISARSELGEVVRCIELGAEDYLPKPFNPVLLRARVNACLERKRLHDSIAAHLARVEAELAVARDLQLNMVPRAFPEPSPAMPIEIAALMSPAREVGGDLYDAFPGPNGRLYLVVGDVADKGVPAAMMMARTRSVVRLTVEMLAGARPSVDAADIVRRVNRELALGNPTMTFVTLFVAVLDPKTGDFVSCNAGHPDPYLIGSGGAPAALTGAKGPPAGLRADADYRSEAATLAPGETMLAYTDGITEALDSAGRLYGMARLESALRSATGGSAQALVDAIRDDLASFAAGAPQADDIAAIALHHKAPG